MKLFLDRNRTLLPRIDFIYFLTRCMTLAGIVWFFLVIEPEASGQLFLYSIIGIYTLHLLLFGLAIRDKFDIKLAYLSSIIFDIVFIPFYIAHTGFVQSSFYLLFFLTIAVAAYVVTRWFATAVTFIVSIAYVATLYSHMSFVNLFDISMRLGFLWVCYLTISYVSDYMRRSEQRLLKLFDTLNMRTSELEKSQVQIEMIYENTRILASLLEPEGVVKEIMRILDRTLQFEQFAIIFRNDRGEYYYRARSIDSRVNFHLKAIQAGKDGLVRKVADMEELVRVKNVADREDYEPLHLDTSAVILAPMSSHGHTHGLLLAESKKKDVFSDKDEQMLSIVARSAGLALENAELHKRTEEMSIIDDLTRAFNYRYFVRKLQEEKKRAIRYKLPLSIIMVDIDWFKKLNDTYGHEVGNIVLTDLAKVIRSCIRDVDVFSRYGGEEFVIILPQTPQAEAEVLAERMREKVESNVINTDNAGKLRITISVGVSSYPENRRSAEDLVSSADQALYRAKGSGKNLVCSV